MYNLWHVKMSGVQVCSYFLTALIQVCGGHCVRCGAHPHLVCAGYRVSYPSSTGLGRNGHQTTRLSCPAMAGKDQSGGGSSREVRIVIKMVIFSSSSSVVRIYHHALVDPNQQTIYRLCRTFLCTFLEREWLCVSSVLVGRKRFASVTSILV